MSTMSSSVPIHQIRVPCSRLYLIGWIILGLKVSFREWTLHQQDRLLINWWHLDYEWNMDIVTYWLHIQSYKMYVPGYLNNAPKIIQTGEQIANEILWKLSCDHVTVSSLQNARMRSSRGSLCVHAFRVCDLRGDPSCDRALHHDLDGNRVFVPCTNHDRRRCMFWPYHRDVCSGPGVLSCTDHDVRRGSACWNVRESHVFRDRWSGCRRTIFYWHRAWNFLHIGSEINLFWQTLSHVKLFGLA